MILFSALCAVVLLIWLLIVFLLPEGLFFRSGKSEYKTGWECPCGCYFEPKGKNFTSRFFIHAKHCPECGRHNDDFKFVTKRYVSNAVLWKPKTWGDGEFEYINN